VSNTKATKLSRPAGRHLAAAPADAAPAPDSRLGLSRARILDAAFALLDREGLDAFSMRRLADELGVATMTIYGYFRSKDELLDAVIDAGAARIVVAEARGSWRARLRQLMLGLRDSLREHPAVVELRLERPIISPGALRLTEAGMQALRDAGFTKHDATRAFRMLFIYTFGFATFGPGRRAEADREQTITALSALPTDSYPALVESAGEAADSMADETVFELGLDCLLDGLERRLEAG
jgi:AcrR family transcriptional regulator